MGKKANKREAKRKQREQRERPMVQPKKSQVLVPPAVAYAPPPAPPAPKTYKELIERSGLKVEWCEPRGCSGMRRISVIKAHRAIVAFVTPGQLTSAQWGNKGRLLHCLVAHRQKNDWPRAKELLEGMLGTTGFEHLMALYEDKEVLIQEEAAQLTPLLTQPKQMPVWNEPEPMFVSTFDASTSNTIASAGG